MAANILAAFCSLPYGELIAYQNDGLSRFSNDILSDDFYAYLLKRYSFSSLHPLQVIIYQHLTPFLQNFNSQLFRLQNELFEAKCFANLVLFLELNKFFGLFFFFNTCLDFEAVPASKRAHRDMKKDKGEKKWE